MPKKCATKGAGRSIKAVVCCSISTACSSRVPSIDGAIRSSPTLPIPHTCPAPYLPVSCSSPETFSTTVDNYDSVFACHHAHLVYYYQCYAARVSQKEAEHPSTPHPAPGYTFQLNDLGQLSRMLKRLHYRQPWKHSAGRTPRPASTRSVSAESTRMNRTLLQTASQRDVAQNCMLRRRNL
jgi:hypothetical protein